MIPGAMPPFAEVEPFTKSEDDMVEITHEVVEQHDTQSHDPADGGADQD